MKVYYTFKKSSCLAADDQTFGRSGPRIGSMKGFIEQPCRLDVTTYKVVC